MINVYTDLKYIPKEFEVENFNDTFFNFRTGTELLTEIDKIEVIT